MSIRIDSPGEIPEPPKDSGVESAPGEIPTHAFDQAPSPTEITSAFTLGEKVALAAIVGTQLPTTIQQLQEAAEVANLQGDAHYAAGTTLDTKAAAFDTDLPEFSAGAGGSVGPASFLHLAAGSLGAVEATAHLAKIGSMGIRISQLKRDLRNASTPEIAQKIGQEIEMLKAKRNEFAKSVALDDTAAFMYFGGALPSFIAGTTAATLATAGLGSVGFGVFLAASGVRDMRAAIKQESARNLEWAHLETKGDRWSSKGSPATQKLKSTLLKGRKNLLAESIRKRTKTATLRAGLKVAIGSASVASGLLTVLSTVGVSIAAGAIAATGIGLAALIVAGLLTGAVAFLYRRRHTIKLMAQYVFHPEKRVELKPQIQRRSAVRKAKKVHKAAVRSAKHLRETDLFAQAVRDMQETEKQLTLARGRLAAMKVASRTGEPNIPQELKEAIQEGDLNTILADLQASGEDFQDIAEIASRVHTKEQLETALLEWMKSAPIIRD